MKDLVDFEVVLEKQGVERTMKVIHENMGMLYDEIKILKEEVKGLRYQINLEKRRDLKGGSE